MRHIALTVVLVLLVLPALLALPVCNAPYAQERQAVPVQGPPAGTYEMLTEDGKTAIPFEFVSNHAVIPVKVEGTTLRLILDTGMPLDGALLWCSERASTLGLTYVGKAPVMGAGGGTVESDLAMGVTFELPGVKFTGQTVILMPGDSTRARYFEGKDGVIGHTLFSRFVVYINYDSLEITLTEPDRFEYTGSGQELPLRIERYPFLKCEAEIRGGQRIPMELVVDTGSGAALTLNVGADERLVLPDKVIEYDAMSVNSDVIRLMGRIERLKVGPYPFDSLLVSFRTPERGPAPAWERAGGLGQGILRRFNTVFDYSRERIILEPGSRFDEPSEFNMAGFQLIRGAQGCLEITRIVPDSPASQAGLMVGDRIAEINGQKAGTLSMDDVEELLTREGQEVVLGVRSGNEAVELRLKLRRLI